VSRRVAVSSAPAHVAEPTGAASGLVGEVFRLLKDRRVPLLMLENVRNMLVLDKGEAMKFLVDELDSLG
jgi:DNA (cytosine-5)-methyltransferase 1